jgi:hypothetical protein
MNKNFFRRLSRIALILIGTTSFVTLHAQSVLEQLQAQYTMSQGTNGCHIGNPETALTTQGPGGGMRVLPVSSSNMIIAKCTNSFTDGKLKVANSACNGSGVGKASGFLSHIPKVGGALGTGSSKVGDQAANQEMDVVATGDKVYPTNLEVNESKGEVKVSFMTCKQAGDQQNPYKGELVFHFKNLKPEDVSKVEDTIGQVFKQGGDDQGNGNGDSNNQQNNDNGGGQANNGNQGQQDQGGAQQNNQSSPCNPEVGQTMKQVVDACGQPANQTKGATKVQYFYNDPKIKVIFVNGKVSDIE